MDTLQSMQVFCCVVEAGSFTKAADALNISTAMASKHVRHLETYLQAKLLHRSSRSLSLTEIGEHYYQRCVLAVGDLDDARKAAMQGTERAQGQLRVTMPAWFSIPFVSRMFVEYQRQNPEVRLSLFLDNTRTDLVAQGIDLALRITTNPESNLIARPITPVQFAWRASPDYLARCGTPQTAADCAEHRGLIPVHAGADLPLRNAFESNNTLMLHQMCLAGVGLAILPDWICHEDVTAGRLKNVLHDHAFQSTLYAAYMDRKYLSAKVRSLIDFMIAYMQSPEMAA